MIKNLLRRRTGWGLVAALMLAGTAGCAELNWNRQEASRPPAAPYQYRSRVVPVRTPSSPPKPAEATDDYKERHPSMWKRKLKATYT